MRTSAVIVCGGLLALCVSCTEYTPKPRGYFRIEPPAPSYQALAVKDIPAFQMGGGGTASGRESGGMDQPFLSAVEREALLQLSSCHFGYVGQGGRRMPCVGRSASEISGPDQSADL